MHDSSGLLGEVEMDNDLVEMEDVPAWLWRILHLSWSFSHFTHIYTSHLYLK